MDLGRARLLGARPCNTGRRLADWEADSDDSRGALRHRAGAEGGLIYELVGRDPDGVETAGRSMDL